MTNLDTMKESMQQAVPTEMQLHLQSLAFAVTTVLGSVAQT